MWSIVARDFFRKQRESKERLGMGECGLAWAGFIPLTIVVGRLVVDDSEDQSSTSKAKGLD